MARKIKKKTLIRDLQNVVQETPAAVTVKIGGTSYTLTGTYVGIAGGELYGALVIGGSTLIVELDRRGTMRNAKVVAEPDLAAVAADLLPVPEPPAEVLAAIEAITAIKLPKGWKWGTDAKGNPQPVEDPDGGGDEVKVRKPRAARGTAIKKEKKPLVVKGMTFTRSKDGFAYKVSGVDQNLKKVYFEPVKKGEGDEGLAATYPAPVFWKNWHEANS